MTVLFMDGINTVSGCFDLAVFSDGDAELEISNNDGDRAHLYVKWADLLALVEQAKAAAANG